MNIIKHVTVYRHLKPQQPKIFIELNFVCSEHIEGAVRFRLEEIRDKSASLPRAIPSPEQFSQQVGKVKLYCLVIKSTLNLTDKHNLLI